MLIQEGLKTNTIYNEKRSLIETEIKTCIQEGSWNNKIKMKDFQYLSSLLFLCFAIVFVVEKQYKVIFLFR